MADNGKHELGEEYIAWLKANNKIVGAACKAGDELALAIVRAYTLYWNRPEQVAAALTEAAIDEYRKRQ